MHATLRKSSRTILLLGIPALWAVQLVGCGVDIDVPERAPTTAEIKGWSDSRIVEIEQAVQKKDWKLPSRVRGLMRYLRGLQINVAIGPGQKYKNSEEAIQAIDQVIAKLGDWYDQSLNRPTGDSDRDLAELQGIIDEAKEILKNVKVTDSSASSTS